MFKYNEQRSRRFIQFACYFHCKVSVAYITCAEIEGLELTSAGRPSNFNIVLIYKNCIKYSYLKHIRRFFPTKQGPDVKKVYGAFDQYENL